MTAEDEQKILSRLVLDEGMALESLDRIVSQATELFLLDPKARKVVLTDKAATHLPDKDKICVFLIGLYYGANKVKTQGVPLFSNEGATATEIASFLGKKITSISGRLTELVREGLIEKEKNGYYRIRYYKIEPTITALVGRITKRG